eukprot:scaffold16686_cov97-Isochrysis_galbana.AAC.1
MKTCSPARRGSPAVSTNAFRSGSKEHPFLAPERWLKESSIGMRAIASGASLDAGEPPPRSDPKLGSAGSDSLPRSSLRSHASSTPFLGGGGGGLSEPMRLARTPSCPLAMSEVKARERTICSAQDSSAIVTPAASLPPAARIAANRSARLSFCSRTAEARGGYRNSASSASLHSSSESANVSGAGR